jgi:hypothetical protein
MFLSYFEWIQEQRIGAVIRESRWLFPVIEAIHLLGFAVAGGAVLLVSLRMLGYRIGSETPGDVVRDVRRWYHASLVVVLSSGFLLFLSEAVKCYNSFAFRIKISALFMAIVATSVFEGRVTSGHASRPLQQAAAVITLALWAAVAWGGRWIGLS